MKLICQNCSAEIPKYSINVQEGIARCSKCNEIFRIADFLIDDERINRISKPYDSKIEITNNINDATISIPPTGWEIPTIVALAVAFLVNGFSLLFVFTSDQGFTLGSIPFFLFGFLCILVFLGLLKGSTEVKIDSKHLMVKWNIFGQGHSKYGKTDGISSIKHESIYKTNESPIYAVVVYFKNGKKLKFGTRISKDEQKWVIGELLNLQNQFKLQRLKKEGKY